MPHKPHVRLFTTLALLAATLPAAALERITLNNGFSYDCARHELLDAGHIRLYMSESNFIDLPAASIAATEILPDTPKIQPVTPLPSTLDTRTLIAHAGTAHNIDVALLAAVIQAESGGHANAVSRTGARGLMQLMPGTARQLNVDDAFQPDQNINGGTAYLDTLLHRYHDNLALALAAYNAGPGAVDRYHGVPPYRETRAYVARVMNDFKHRKLAGQSAPPRLTASATH